MDREGFALKLPKCEFSVNRISWLGFAICKTGYQPKFSKVQAFLELKPQHFKTYSFSYRSPQPTTECPTKSSTTDRTIQTFVKNE